MYCEKHPRRKRKGKIEVFKNLTTILRFVESGEAELDGNKRIYCHQDSPLLGELHCKVRTHQCDYLIFTPLLQSARLHRNYTVL